MGIYPFEDYQHYSPNIHTTNDLIGPSVNSFEMSQQYCRMNIGCLAELANPAGEPQIYCNPVNNFTLYDEFDNRELSSLVLEWEDPSEGSTGNIQHFDIYRDNEVIATVQYGDYYTIGVVGEYKYTDTITVDVHAFYYINAIYDDGCEAASETLEGVGHTDDVPEIDALDGDVVRYEVYDLMGRKVDRHELDELKAGIYIVKYYKKSGSVFTKKIVKR